VLQDQAEVATRVEALLLARNELQRRQDDLKLIVLGDPGSELWSKALIPETGLPPEVDASDVPRWADALLVALENRSDLRVQRVAIESARLGLLRAESERLAGLDLEVSASSNGQSTDPGEALDDTFGWEFPGWSVRLTYNMPIGNRAARQAVVAAEAQVRLARVDEQRAEMAAVAEVRDAVREVRYRAEAVRAAVTSLRLAERQLEAEQARYDEGLSTNFQVLEFQRDLVEAQRGERQARVEYVKARTQLLAAQGLLDGRRSQ
jgi:outer membrane protein